jgi:CRP-like cAMP-binding protein
MGLGAILLPVSDQGERVPLVSPEVSVDSAPSAVPPPVPAPKGALPIEPVGVQSAFGEALELLAKVHMFEGLRPAHLKRIAGIGSREKYEPGATIFSEGAVGDRMYLILSGAVRISREVAGMGEEALAVLRPGNHFGEMSLIDDSPRSADAKAHEASELFVIRKEELEDVLFVDRDLAYDLLWNLVRTLSGRLRETNDKMTFLAMSNKF